MPLDMSDIMAELAKNPPGYKPPRWTDWAAPVFFVLFLMAVMALFSYLFLIALLFLSSFL
jgi:hypothetical protein